MLRLFDVSRDVNIKPDLARIESVHQSCGMEGGKSVVVYISTLYGREGEE